MNERQHLKHRKTCALLNSDPVLKERKGIDKGEKQGSPIRGKSLREKANILNVSHGHWLFLPTLNACEIPV